MMMHGEARNLYVQYCACASHLFWVAFIFSVIYRNVRVCFHLRKMYTMDQSIWICKFSCSLRFIWPVIHAHCITVQKTQAMCSCARCHRAKLSLHIHRIETKQYNWKLCSALDIISFILTFFLECVCSLCVRITRTYRPFSHCLILNYSYISSFFLFISFLCR